MPHTSLSLALTKASETATGMFAQTQEENQRCMRDTSWAKHLQAPLLWEVSRMGSQALSLCRAVPEGRWGSQTPSSRSLSWTPHAPWLCVIHQQLGPRCRLPASPPSKPRVFGGLPRLWVPALLQAGKPWAEQASLGVFGRRLPPTLARAERPCCTAALPAAAALNPVLLPHKRLICYIFSDAVNGRTKTFSLSYFCSIMFVGEPDPLQRGAREVEEASQAC